MEGKEDEKNKESYHFDPGGRQKGWTETVLNIGLKVNMY